jgi:curved DNA-binding protein CbpA
MPWKSRWKKRPRAKTHKFASPVGILRSLQRQRRQARHPGQDLRTPAGLRFGTNAPGFLQRAANLPHLPRHRQGHSRALLCLPRPRQESRSKKRWKSKFRPALTAACASAAPATVNPAPMAGLPGDLYIEIRLKKHDIFERDGDDLHCSVPISMATASAGW